MLVFSLVQASMLKSFVLKHSPRSLLRPLSAKAGGYSPSTFLLVQRRGLASEAEEHDVVVIGMLRPPRSLALFFSSEGVRWLLTGECV